MRLNVGVSRVSSMFSARGVWCLTVFTYLEAFAIHFLCLYETSANVAVRSENKITSIKGKVKAKVFLFYSLWFVVPLKLLVRFSKIRKKRSTVFLKSFSNQITKKKKISLQF